MSASNPLTDRRWTDRKPSRSVGAAARGRPLQRIIANRRCDGSRIVPPAAAYRNPGGFGSVVVGRVSLRDTSKAAAFGRLCQNALRRTCGLPPSVCSSSTCSGPRCAHERSRTGRYRRSAASLDRQRRPRRHPGRRPRRQPHLPLRGPARARARRRLPCSSCWRAPGGASGSSTSRCPRPEQELRLVANRHGWSLDEVDVFELVPPETSLDPDRELTVFHPAEMELNETTKLDLRPGRGD